MKQQLLRTASAIPQPWRIPALVVLGLVLVGLFFFSGKPHGWWNGDWASRQAVTVDPSAAGADGAVGAQAVLVRLHDGDFQFAGTKDDGSDLRFVSADGKVLNHQIEKYDGLLGEAFVWVQVPDLKGGAPAKLWLYYGNGKAAAPSTEKVPYDGDTVLAYHFAEKGQPPQDASGNGNNASAAGIPANGALIGTGLKMNGTTNITIPASPSMEWTANGAMTFSAWVKPAALAANATVFSRAGAFTVGLANGMPYADLNGQHIASATAVAANSWHHLAVVSDAGKTALYVDGNAMGNAPASLPALNTDSTLGGTFAGEVDELEIAKVARSEGWVKLAAAVQGATPTKALVVGAAQDTGSSSGGTNIYWTILKNVTIDGWIVILVLVVLGVMAAKVAWAKWEYLKANAEANARFAKAWRNVSSDLTVLDHGDADKIKTMGGRIGAADIEGFRASSVYRLYHIGAEEVRHRLAKGTKVLSAQSIQAIRASLDTGLVQENEKFNAELNTLTNSIAGGPFIGLAGTVAGVTITFASIAAAGEVNVNAIAPGISAALVATLAGLFVAIPATFVYNFLSAKIESANHELQVFIDEYVTKLAEFYRSGQVHANGNGNGNGGSSHNDLLDGLSRLIESARR